MLCLDWIDPDICEDPRQQLYTRCSYGGGKCTNPIPQYWDPPLCGGHCDTMEMGVAAGGEESEGGGQEGGGGGGGRELSIEKEKSVEADVLALSCDEAVMSGTLQRHHS